MVMQGGAMLDKVRGTIENCILFPFDAVLHKGLCQKFLRLGNMVYGEEMLGIVMYGKVRMT